MTGLHRSTFGPKSKLANLPMVNDTDIDHASTGQSKITGWKLAAQLTNEAVERPSASIHPSPAQEVVQPLSGLVHPTPGGQGSGSKKRMIVEVEIPPRKKVKIDGDNKVKRKSPQPVSYLQRMSHMLVKVLP